MSATTATSATLLRQDNPVVSLDGRTTLSYAVENNRTEVEKVLRRLLNRYFKRKERWHTKHFEGESLSVGMLRFGVSIAIQRAIILQNAGYHQHII
jgi:hypothetical protein